MNIRNKLIAEILLALIFVTISLVADNLFIRTGIIIVLLIVLHLFFHKVLKQYIKDIKSQTENLLKEKNQYIEYIKEEFNKYWDNHKNDLFHTEQTIKAVIMELLTRNEILPVFSNQLQAVIEQTETAALSLTGSFRDINKKAKSQAKRVMDVFTQTNTQDNANIFDQNKIVLTNLLTDFLELASHNKNLAAGISEVITNLEGIKNITDEIEEIAGMTKILAMNAAIVATRAGSESKGFKIIADEVRALSDKSSEYVEAIRGKVGNLLANSQSIYQQLERDIVASSNLSSQSSLTIEKTLKEMDERVNYLTDNLRDIQTDTEAIAKDLNQIVVSIQFQDITRQRIEHVIEPLDKFHQELGQIMSRLHTIGKDLDKTEQISLDKWLEQFYTMAEERKIMEDTLYNKKNIATQKPTV